MAALGMALGLLLAFWKASLWLLVCFLPLLISSRYRVGFLFLALGYLYGNLSGPSLLEIPSSGGYLLEGYIQSVSPRSRGALLKVKTPQSEGSVRIYFEAPECRPGGKMVAQVKPSPKGYIHPFEPLSEERLRARGESFAVRIFRPENLYCYPGRGLSLRDRILEMARDFSPPAGGLLAALVTGEKALLPPEIKERLRLLGIYHFLAVSGFHLGLLYALLYAMVRGIWVRFGDPERIPALLPASLAGLFGALFYAFLSGPSPSAQRALVMLALFTLARILWQRVSGLDLLAGAVLIILLLCPENVLSLSFRLSVLAVWGLIWAYGSLGRRIPFRRRIWRWPLEGLLLSLAAFFFTAPLIWYAFGEVPLLSPVNTVLLSLLWTLLLIPGELVVAFLGLISPELARRPAEFLGRALEASLNLPWPTFSWSPPFPVGLFVLTFVATGAFLYALWQRQSLKALAFLLLALLFLSAGLYARFGLFYILVFDVGRGNAVWVHLPGDRNLLFDAGAPYGSTSRGGKYLARLFKKFGVSSFKAVILSHPDRDHTGALPALKEAFGPLRTISGEFAEGSVVPEETLERPQGLRLGEAEVILLPGRPGAREGNRESLVAFLEYRGLTVFLPGDADRLRLARLKASHYVRPAEIFLLPHHGSRTGLFPPLWRELRFRVALASARGRWHPHPEVEEFLRREGLPLYVTARSGTIAIFLKDSRFLICELRKLKGGLPKELLWPYIPYLNEEGCHSYELHTLRDL